MWKFLLFQNSNARKLVAIFNAFILNIILVLITMILYST